MNLCFVYGRKANSEEEEEEEEEGEEEVNDLSYEGG